MSAVVPARLAAALAARLGDVCPDLRSELVGEPWLAAFWRANDHGLRWARIRWRDALRDAAASVAHVDSERAVVEAVRDGAAYEVWHRRRRPS